METSRIRPPPLGPGSESPGRGAGSGGRARLRAPRDKAGPAASCREPGGRARGAAGAAGAQGARPEGARTARAPALGCAWTPARSPRGPPGRGTRGHSLISMLWNKERLQSHVQETLGCPAAAAVLLTPIKRCMGGAAARRWARGARGRPGGAPAGARRSGPACRRRAAGKARPGSPGSGRRQVSGAPRDSARGAALPCTPRPPLRSPGGVGRARVRRPGNGLAAGARAAAGAEALPLASPGRAPPPPPPPPHSSPRRSGFAPRPRSEAGRRSDVSARRGCRFPPRGGRGGGARCANPSRGSPAPPPRAAGRGDSEGGGPLKGQSAAARGAPGSAQRRGAASPPRPRRFGTPAPHTLGRGQRDWVPAATEAGCLFRPPRPHPGSLILAFGGSLSLQRSTRSPGLGAGEVRERGGGSPPDHPLPEFSGDSPQNQVRSRTRPLSPLPLPPAPPPGTL